MINLLFVFGIVWVITADEEFILEEQYRPRPERSLISMPEGKIEDAENSVAAARRKLLEENAIKRVT